MSTRPGDEQQEEQAAEEVHDVAHGGSAGPQVAVVAPQDVPAHGEGHRHHDEGDPHGDVQPLGTLAGGELGASRHGQKSLSAFRRMASRLARRQKRPKVSSRSWFGARTRNDRAWKARLWTAIIRAYSSS